MELIKCKYCGNEFEPITDRQVFCCAGCRTKYGNERQRSQRKNQVYEKVIKCCWCNKEFTILSPSRQKYCSKDCKWEATKKKKREAARKISKTAKIKEKPVKKAKVLSITEINVRAFAEGLSYGQYVSKYGVK